MHYVQNYTKGDRDMLLEELDVAIKDAMRKKMAVKRDTLRAVVSDIRLASKEAKRDLTDEEQMDIVKRHIKQVKESVEAYSLGGREDLVLDEKLKLMELEAFLPKQMTEEEINAIIEEEIVKMGLDTTNKGMLLKHLMPLFKYNADGKVVNGLISKHVTK